SAGAWGSKVECSAAAGWAGHSTRSCRHCHWRTCSRNAHPGAIQFFAPVIRRARHGLADFRSCVALSAARRAPRVLPASPPRGTTGSHGRTPQRLIEAQDVSTPLMARELVTRSHLWEISAEITIYEDV